MKLKMVIHEAEEGGFWAEIPEMPGCCSQGRTREEVLRNLREAVEGCVACRKAQSNTSAGAAPDDVIIDLCE